MVNLFLEIERLKATLRSKGIEDDFIEDIAAKADMEIQLALRERFISGMELAIQSGVQKDSAEFINDLRPKPGAFLLETASGSTDFTEPPKPMLDRLLARGAKPMKDGSGVYKVIPIGQSSGKPKRSVYSSIFDAQKAIAAERYETSVKQYSKIAPKGSKVQFRTATSKQNRATQWVSPEKPKDFTDDLKSINDMLLQEYNAIIANIIRSYEEGF